MSIRIPEATITLMDGKQVDGVVCPDYRGQVLLLDRSTSSIIYIPSHAIKSLNACIYLFPIIFINIDQSEPIQIQEEKKPHNVNQQDYTEAKSKIIMRLKEAQLEFKENEGIISMFDGSLKIIAPYDQSSVICDNDIVLQRINTILFSN